MEVAATHRFDLFLPRRASAALGIVEGSVSMDLRGVDLDTGPILVGRGGRRFIRTVGLLLVGKGFPAQLFEKYRSAGRMAQSPEFNIGDYRRCRQ